MTYCAQDIRFADGWKPFRLAPERGERMRAIHSMEGIGDRLRAVAFAELQARDGFLWGLEKFPNADPQLRSHWQVFAEVEELHAQLLLDRAKALGVDLAERTVSDTLMRMFVRSDSVELFLYQIATAEERGMQIGLSMIEPIRKIDPESAAVFQRIAEDEVDHVETAQKFMVGLDLMKLRERAQLLSRIAQG